MNFLHWLFGHRWLYRWRKWDADVEISDRKVYVEIVMEFRICSHCGKTQYWLPELEGRGCWKDDVCDLYHTENISLKELSYSNSIPN
jgi:hypothetical protein